jgi:hypothetical protein
MFCLFLVIIQLYVFSFDLLKGEYLTCLVTGYEVTISIAGLMLNNLATSSGDVWNEKIYDLPR